MNCGELKINIGCGRDDREGFIGVDLVDTGGNIKVRDVEKHGLPFCDDSALEVHAVSFLEHIAPQNLAFVMNEFHRVLKGGGVGKLWLVIPHWETDGAHRDPTHKSFFSENSIDYFTHVRPRNAKYSEFNKWDIIENLGKVGGDDRIREKGKPLPRGWTIRAWLTPAKP